MAVSGNLVNIDKVSKAFGTTTVLTDVSLGLGSGERIGVVGRNGGGKSTLLSLIIGDQDPDSGRVTRTGGVAIATVAQQDALQGTASVRDAVLGSAAEHEWAGDSSIRQILGGLGLSRLGLDVTIGRLSGGERRRVCLAQALVQHADLLVLDEPTNHLDVEAIAWLAHHLNNRRSSLLVVTHDRWFLDEVCTRTWEVSDGTVRQFDGGYAAYVLARAERDRQAEASQTRRNNLLRKELAWLRRGAPARTSKPKFRIDAAEALIADVPAPRSTADLKALAAKRLGSQVFELHDVTVAVGTEGTDDRRLLLDKVDWRVGPGDRIALIGVNGSGKTHVLKLLAAVSEPTSGRVKIGSTVKVAYLSQDVAELPNEMRVIEAVNEVRSSAEIGGVELSAGQLAERFGFEGSKQWTPVSDLSGGERRRLQLLRLLLTQPNVLLLDEPTNDLDTDTLASLEDLLDSWAGTMVVVSHDRYLVERICDVTVALMGDGSLAELPGGIEQYLSIRLETGMANGGTPEGGDTSGGAARQKTGDTRSARKELTRLERQIATLDKQERRLHDELATNATDYQRIAELDEQLRTVVAQRTEAEEAWLELSDSV